MSDTRQAQVAVRQDDQMAHSVLNLVATALERPEISAEKLRELLAIQREILADDDKMAFNRDLAAMQGRIRPVEKNGVVTLIDKSGVDKGSYRFTTREDMEAVLQPLRDEYGFNLTWDTTSDERGITVIGELTKGRYSKKSQFILPPDSGPGRNPLQARGSSYEYGKRYVLEALFNIVRKGAGADDGGMFDRRVITRDQADELRALTGEVGRQEGPTLDRMFSGAVRSFEEVPADSYVVVKNTLLGIKHQRANKGAPQ